VLFFGAGSKFVTTRTNECTWCRRVIVMPELFAPFSHKFVAGGGSSPSSSLDAAIILEVVI
jgi:hypothetical protein